jgi:hypothetical protein
MSWRTTGILFVILAVLAAYVLLQQNQESGDGEPTPTSAAASRLNLVTGITLDQVVRLDVSRAEDGAFVSLARTEFGEWSRTVPTATAMISNTMNSRVTGLINMASRETFEPGLNPLSAYGLDEPAYTFTLAARQNDRTLRFKFLVGSETPTGSGFYVQRSGDDRVFVILQTTVNNMINMIDDPPIYVPPTPTPTIEATAAPETTATPVP